MRVKFTQDYDHYWRPGALTAYKAGMELTVKREVGEQAIAKGRATEIKRRAKAKADEAAPNMAGTGSLVQRDDGGDGGSALRGPVSPAGQR